MCIFVCSVGTFCWYMSFNCFPPSFSSSSFPSRSFRPPRRSFPPWQCRGSTLKLKEHILTSVISIFSHLWTFWSRCAVVLMSCSYHHAPQCTVVLFPKFVPYPASNNPREPIRYLESAALSHKGATSRYFAEKNRSTILPLSSKSSQSTLFRPSLVPYCGNMTGFSYVVQANKLISPVRPIDLRKHNYFI